MQRFVQICPNDGPPFLDLCAVYAKAAARLGLPATTVFLSPSRQAGHGRRPAECGSGALLAGSRSDRPERASPGNCYLDVLDLRAMRVVRAGLRRLLPDVGDSLVLCHRYRAYRAFVRSGLTAARVVALAHEHGFFKRRGRRLVRRIFGVETSFAGVSPTIVSELEGVAGAALHLPNALDTESLEWSDRDQARRELGLPEDGVCIGLIGRLHYKKNPILALDAFRHFNDRHGPAHLGIVGDGDMRRRMEEHAREMPVTFAGFVHDPKRLVRAFDAVLLTSGPRAFPIMVALEAMAADVPVVAPRLPDSISVVGRAGCYFDDHRSDSVALALHQAVTSGVPGAGPERVRDEFSVDAVAQGLERLLT